MPMRVNGIGTWYYGRQNPHQYTGVCQACGKNAILRSYDTRSYITIFFIPFVPLGRKRIMDECSVCRRHHAISLKKFRRLRDESLGEIQEKLGAGRMDRQGAVDALGAFLFFREKEAFLAAAPTIRNAWAQDAQVLVQLAAVYEFYNCAPEAEEAYWAALALDDSPAVRESVAEFLIWQRRPEEAAELLGHLDTERDPDEAVLLLKLAKSWQALGEHTRALEVFDRIEGLAIQDKKLVKLIRKSRKLSEQNRRTGKPIRNEMDPRHQGVAGPRTDVGGRFARWAAPAVLVILALVWLLTAWGMGREETIHLVNGLDRPYTANINGQVYRLAPMSARSVVVPEGDIRVEVVDPALKIEPQVYDIRTPFLTRPLNDSVFVLNPDAVAPINWIQAYYAEDFDRAPDPEERLHVGQTLYRFKGIDYPFRPFPDELQFSGDYLRKRGLELLDDPELRPYLPYVIAEQVSEDAAFDYVRRRLDYDPDGVEWLNALAGVTAANPFRALAVLEPGLAARPVRMQWHRFYQQIALQIGSEEAVRDKYADWLRQEPDNPDLMYLLARISDYRQVDGLIAAALETRRPCPWIHHLIACRELGYGRFEEALASVGRALAAEPNDPVFTAVQRECLLATGRFDEAIQAIREAHRAEPGSAWVEMEAAAYVMKGDIQAARGRIDAWMSEIEQDWGEQGWADYRVYWDWWLAYASGDLEQCRRICTDSPKPWMWLENAVMFDADPNEADLDEVTEATEFLALYIADMHRGRTDRAAGYRRRAIDLLAGGDGDARRIGAMLVDDVELDVDAACAVAFMPAEKRTILTALALHHPQHRQRLLGLARRLNYYPTFPRHLLDQVHAAPAIAPAAQ